MGVWNFDFNLSKDIWDLGVLELIAHFEFYFEFWNFALVF